MDEAHRLRNVYKPGNVIGKDPEGGAGPTPPKCCSPPHPLQNSPAGAVRHGQPGGRACLATCPAFASSSARWQPRHQLACAAVCKACACAPCAARCSPTSRTRGASPWWSPLRHRQKNRPCDRVAGLTHLRRPSLNALPAGQRQLISLVLWKLLASSSYAIGGALDTMAQRLQDQLSAQPEARKTPAGRATGQRTTSPLDEIEEEWTEADGDAPGATKPAWPKKLPSCEFQRMATTIATTPRARPCSQPWAKLLPELERLGAKRKAPHLHGIAPHARLFAGPAGAKRLRRPNRALQRHQQQ